MTKSLTKLFTLIAVASVVFFSSCKKSEDATVAAPTATLTDANTAANPSYEKGDQITYTLTATIPGGYKAGSGKKTVDGTDTPFNLTGPSAGDTTITANFTIDVTEEAGKEVTVSITIIDANDANVTAEAKYTVAAVGQGGGGAAPLLSGSATLQLGTQGASAGSYLSTATNGSTIGEVFGSSTAQANVSKIDIFAGATASDGSSVAASGSSAVTSFISPSNVTTGNSWTGITGGRATKFAASSLTDLNVTALSVENNVSTTTGATAIGIAQGKVYSFVTADGKKGYILIEKITDNGVNSGNLANRTIDVKFVVQQ